MPLISEYLPPFESQAFQILRKAHSYGQIVLFYLLVYFFFPQTNLSTFQTFLTVPQDFLPFLQLLKFARANSLEVRDQSLVLVQLYII